MYGNNICRLHAIIVNTATELRYAEKFSLKLFFICNFGVEKQIDAISFQTY